MSDTIAVALAPWGQVVQAPRQMVEDSYHSPDQCEGEWCCVHNPSDHHMKDWPVCLRLDKGALMERTCSHGVGHPDPDSLAYYERQGMEWMGVHGCDGCCAHE